MQRISSLLASCLLTINLFGQSHTPTQYIFELISEDSGFTFSEITSIVTDENNMIWFGCDNGLYHYDNNKFTHYSHEVGNERSIPSNAVRSLYCDSSNKLWVDTAMGLCYYDSASDSFERVYFNRGDDFDVSTIVEYRPSEFLTTFDGKLYTFSGDNLEEIREVETGIKPSISCIYKSDVDRIYIGCEEGSLYTSDESLETFRLRHSGAGSRITSICRQYDRVYIGYLGSGVDAIDLQNNHIRRYRVGSTELSTTLPDNFVKTISKRLNGDIWIGTGGGIVVITPSETRIIKSNDFNNLTRNSIYSIHVDKQDAVWVGTWAGNIVYYNQSNYRFMSNLGMFYNNRNPGQGFVYHFAPHNNQTTWVAGEWSGLALHDHNTNRTVAQYGQNLHIKTLRPDKNGNLWIGTIKQGLYFFNNSTKGISQITIPEDIIPELILSAIAVDEKRNLVWIGTRGAGLIAYDISTKESIMYNSSNTDNFTADAVWALEMIDDELFICADNGFSVRDKSGEFTPYEFAGQNSSDDIAFSLCLAPNNKGVYVGTKEQGIQLFDFETKQFEEIEANNIFSKYIIYNIVRDNRGQLWLSSNNGVYRYNTESKEVKHFTKTDGLNSMQFHPGSSVMTQNEVLYFGTTTGFNFINTRSISEDKTAPHSFISDIFINNAPLNEHNCKYIDNKHFAATSRIELTHKNNSITLEVTSNNSLKSGNGEFKYRLVGYEDKWVKTTSNDITFTKLPFGNYTFEVASCNSDGIWGREKAIDIKIYAPIYLKWYAILIYAIIFTLACVYIIRQTAFKIKARKDIEIEREINIISNRSFDEKLKFFMNISHELRTPLSLIKAPLGILERETNSKESLIHINAIKRNTEQLLKLTNQILDFRLLEVGKLNTTLSKFDIIQLCDQTLELFEYHIKERQIDFTFEKSSESISVSLDKDMINKMVYNLITNALKYTQEGASITLKVENRNLSQGDIEYDVCKGAPVVGSAIVLSVEDSGCGIKSEQIEHIFDRFYFNANEAFSSSGIGLHMCMEYTNLHHGNISVSSQEGKGTRFTIALPMVCSPIVETELIKTTPYAASNTHCQEAELAVKDQHKSTVLIVDDNAEIRFYLKKILSKAYNCITAKNGQQGYDMALDIKPDVIILDVLMPVLGGVECAHKLRKQESTKYIPIIMLTGLTDDNRIIQGVKAGADAYLSKPINELLLFTHIERLVTRHVEMQSKVIESKPTAAASIAGDSSFIQKIDAIMEQYIQDSSLDVNLIAEQMLVSRSTLHRNFKREMNMGVAEYIRDYRLKSAVKLMENGVYNIDELSICVGFNSSSYFCKAFKDKYGVSPKKHYDSLRM